MRVTLTFDNGPHPAGTPQVLDELSRRDIQGIFFVVGRHLVAGDGELRGLVERAAAEGHLIGNHTWSHSGPLGEPHSPRNSRFEILRTQELMSRLSTDPPLFRPVGRAPGGVVDDWLLDEDAAKVLRDGRFTLALWNVLPHDWDDPDGWLERARQQLKGIDHAVLVLHDAYPEGLRHLPAFLDDIAASGATFTTELPADCTPMVAGHARADFDALVYGRTRTHTSHPSDKQNLSL